ncbi:MAG TPA: hypothetical protein VHY31_13695 [Streptosporangiaceae bacterium]|nr:hypothetical protein [Streptosporangiaceae bacterium]
MTGTDLLQDATAELYSCDPDAFVERRKALTAQARAAGQRAAAKQIAALRKPTRPAWVVNRLVQAAPEVPGELASLGDELLTAQRDLDGAAIRELSQRRRQLIETLVRRAFTLTGQQDPPAALRDEVAATLAVALADPRVAAELATATLTRAAHGEGFGPPGPPELSVLPGGGAGAEAETQTQPDAAPGRPGRARQPARPRQTAQERAEASAKAKAEAQARAEAERERRRQENVAAAEQAVTAAGQAAEAATAAEQEQENLVERLEVQLADAREALAKTRSTARRARNRQHQARQALTRLRP